MPHPEYERTELVHLCTVITRSSRPPSHAGSAFGRTWPPGATRGPGSSGEILVGYPRSALRQ